MDFSQAQVPNYESFDSYFCRYLRTGSKWHSHRKLITPAFHFKILESFMDVFVSKTQILLKILDGKCNGNPFNIYPDITDCALDIICGRFNKCV